MRQTSPAAVCRSRSDSMEGGKTLNECVYKNDVDGVKNCLHLNVMAWNTKNTSGMTPLMEASTLNRTEILDILLSSKCDVNVTDENGNTALHLAVDEGNTEVVKKLVESGRCIVDAMNNKGETALMKAAFYDYGEMTRTLLKDGSADPDIKDISGQTALLIALREGSHMTVDLLLKNGCDVTATDNLGQSALYIAVHATCNKTLDLAKRLVSAGYNSKVDKMWLLNEEKHNLFYQDDEFYVALRRQLRNHSGEVPCAAPSGRKISAGTSGSPSSTHSLATSPKETSPTSPPFAMSPTLKHKIMSPQSSKFPSIPFSRLAAYAKPEVELHPPRLSPLASRRGEYKKAASYELTTPVTRRLRPPLRSSFSSDSDDSPIGSPVLRPRLLPHQASRPVRDMTSYNHAATTVPLEPARRSAKIGRSTTFSTPSNTKPVYLKNDNEQIRSAPGSPIIRYKRQLSTQPSISNSDSVLNQRKISLPNKTVVQFSTEIQIFQYNNRQ